MVLDSRLLYASFPFCRSPQTDYAKQVYACLQKYSIHCKINSIPQVKYKVILFCDINYTLPFCLAHLIPAPILLFPRMEASLTSSLTRRQRCPSTPPSGTFSSPPPSRSGASGSTNKTGSTCSTHAQQNCW